MESLAQDLNEILLKTHAPPCLSLYQRTHRHHPDNRQDPIRFGNLLISLQGSLQQGYPQHDHAALLQPLRALAGDRNFWNQTLDGLAVLASRGLFRVYRLQRPTPERAFVADSFHVKPLIRILQSADRYQLLALTRRNVRLFEGNRDVVDEIPLEEEVPRTIEEALGDERTEPYLTRSGRTGSGAAMFHGHGSKRDEKDIDTERFFRAVDRSVWLHHSRPSRLPLILAALPEHHATFRRVSRNLLLVDSPIGINPDTLDTEALRRLGWEAEKPRYLALTADLVRVAILMVDADHHVPGRLDVHSGRIETTEAPDVDDLLDDLAELVLKRGGQAIVIGGDRMPTRTGVAAIYRY